MLHLSDPREALPTRVLVVAQSQALRGASVDCLRRWTELRVVGAVRGADAALACVRGLQPHVILVDLDVPRDEGLDLIPRLHALVPRAKIVGLALSDGNSHRRAALAAGVDAMVSKGDMVRELLPTIKRVALRNPSPDRVGALAGR